MAPPRKTKASSNGPAAVWAASTDVLVTGPKRGRWRAGMKFGAEPKRLVVADLTDDEKIAIDLDPVLSVVPAPAGENPVT